MVAYVPGSEETDLKRLILSLQQLAAGRSNAVGQVTLTTNAATTAVLTPNCAAGSVPRLTPITSAAAAETWYVSSVANGSFTITHTNSATANRTFLYAIQG